jgi:putative FmdB family regulatory protein
MPRYDFQCPECEFVKERFVPVRDFTERIEDSCPKHGTQEFVLILSLPACHDWGADGQGRYYENVSAEGMHFTSKRQLKDYLKAHGLREEASYG